jgi:hypothetical protein
VSEQKTDDVRITGNGKIHNIHRNYI